LREFHAEGGESESGKIAPSGSGFIFRLKRFRGDFSVRLLQENFDAAFGFLKLLLAFPRKFDALFEELHGFVEREIGAFEPLDYFLEAREGLFKFAFARLFGSRFICCRAHLRSHSNSKPRSNPNRRILHLDAAEAQNHSMPLEFTTSYAKDALDILKQYKRLAERALEQAPDQALNAALDVESNSIAVIVKHLAGNMRSRFTDFLTSDGEKPDRNRDGEFEAAPQTRAEIMALWEAGWKHVFDAIAPLTDEDLARTVKIRGEAHSVMQALNRQVAHYSYHVGQIVFLAKHFAASGSGWTAVTIPRGKSGDFTQQVAAGKASQR